MHDESGGGAEDVLCRGEAGGYRAGSWAVPAEGASNHGVNQAENFLYLLR